MIPLSNAVCPVPLCGRPVTPIVASSGRSNTPDEAPTRSMVSAPLSTEQIAGVGASERGLSGPSGARPTPSTKRNRMLTIDFETREEICTGSIEQPEAGRKLDSQNVAVYTLFLVNEHIRTGSPPIPRWSSRAIRSKPERSLRGRRPEQRHDVASGVVHPARHRLWLPGIALPP